ncbi:MAG: cytochrome P450 [Brevundimonas sp.]|uniref:cytochrome P450 n=1 Tax=Brevundimonas sp. TaxID=1871086 RepID=UPI002488A5E0|nr:cytochrome P450 [Brevundimonas sp.]MDI1327581.1 cytochrome P450 [Brevundimonas sp.]
MSITNATHDRPRTCPVGESVVGFADRDPFGFYERLREAGSPTWDPEARAWLVHDFDQCLIAERDESRFANAYVFADEIVKEIKGGGANITLSRDGDHVKLRRFHFKLLSAANIESYRQIHIAPVLAASLARLEGRTTADLAADYAAIIPARVICSLLGMPTDDDAMVAEILACNDAIVAFIASGYRDTDLRDKALAASRRLNEMLLPYIRARRDEPADDFISRVWRDAPDFGIHMDEEAALGICRELFFAGSDTTVHGIANALYLVLADPKLMDKVRANPEDALPAVVEESLRLMNVVQFRHRFCMEDTEVGDTTVKKGEMIILLHAAANRDPERFPCPADVDLDRPDLTGHLAFARGTRSCVGSSLARTEMHEAVREIIDRFPHLHLDASAEPPSFRGLYMRSMGPLNVILGPSA